MGVQINDDFKKKTPEEQILEKESINKHIHGGPKTIEELSEYVNFKEDYYFNTYNRISAEKRKILSGQRVYFYSWAMGNRLCVGTAIHNINNMWWVISGGILHNVACFELYLDISRIPLKNPRLCKRAEDRIEQKMIKMASERDYVGALAFQKKLEILKIENEKRKIKWKEYLQQENF